MVSRRRVLKKEGDKKCQLGCTPNSFVMDVFILKTKLLFKAAIAGLGQADGRIMLG